MNLESIAALLEEAGLGVQGTSIFIHRMPENQAGFILREGYSGDWISYDYPGWREGDMLLTYRSNSYADGKAQIEAAMVALSYPYGVTVGDVKFNYMRPRTTPMVYPLSAGNNTEFAVHIDVCYVG